MVLNANGFGSDDLTFCQAVQAASIFPVVEFEQIDLISQMARINIAYGNKYDITLNGRRDGFSVSGSGNKWCFFHRVASGLAVYNVNFWP